LNNLIANWEAPSNIRALTTLRTEGKSLAPYDQNNLALHVGDNEKHVHENRKALIKNLNLPGEPIWLNQTHTTKCIRVEEDDNREADAAITQKREFPLVIMTADCLPIVLCNKAGTEIAAIHAGWRGLANGIIENTLKKLISKNESMLAWIGPSICKSCFEIGKEVYDSFTGNYPFTKETFNINLKSSYANLPKMAELILNANGVKSVYHSDACTYELKNKFYSYRREKQTGRIATLIWFNNV
jgi:polyphenol oxidase